VTPRYPIYVISKGRWKSRLTVKALVRCRVPHRVVIEPQEYPQYAAVIDPATILVLPFSNLGLGSIPARNWVWDHAAAAGHARHWILDDNIGGFRRYHHGRRVRVADGSPFYWVEQFADRYVNLALAGMQYNGFGAGVAYTGGRNPPVAFNTRIYSCILIQNDIPFRWRGRYNEDTDLSLRALKAGWCTALFYAFLCDKAATMTMRGGNTDDLYAGDGRLQMALSLVAQHPDCVRVTRKWGRWQHLVDYRPFKRNRLVFRPGAAPAGTHC
jgi:hypothetical protein